MKPHWCHGKEKKNTTRQRIKRADDDNVRFNKKFFMLDRLSSFPFFLLILNASPPLSPDIIEFYKMFSRLHLG